MDLTRDVRLAPDRVVASIERKTGLSALDPSQVEVVLPEWIDVFAHQWRNPSEVGIGNRMAIPT